MSDRQDHWERVYGSKRENEVSWFQDIPAISLDLIGEAGATQDSAIIDIGGGASRLVDTLLLRGFRSVAVLDLSQAALTTARNRIGGPAAAVEWIAADVTQWKPARRYDIWHDRAAFHFLVDAEDRRAYVKVLEAALRPGGQAIIGTFAPDGPDKCSGLPVQRYDAESLRKTLGDAFNLKTSHCETHVTPWASKQAFQFARFERIDA